MYRPKSNVSPPDVGEVQRFSPVVLASLRQAGTPLPGLPLLSSQRAQGWCASQIHALRSAQKQSFGASWLSHFSLDLAGLVWYDFVRNHPNLCSIDHGHLPTIRRQVVRKELLNWMLIALCLLLGGCAGLQEWANEPVGGHSETSTSEATETEPGGGGPSQR